MIITRSAEDIDYNGSNLLGRALTFNKEYSVADNRGRPIIESYDPAAFNRTLSGNAQFPLYANHLRNVDPLGVVTFSVKGNELMFDAEIMDRGVRGDLYRSMAERRVFTDFSIGAVAVTPKTPDARGRIHRMEVKLIEGSLVHEGAFDDAEALVVRAQKDVDWHMHKMRLLRAGIDIFGS